MRRIGRESHLDECVSTHALSLTRASSFDSASWIRWMGFARNFYAQKKTSRVYVSCFKPSNTIWRNSRLRRADNESNFRNFSRWGKLGIRVCHHVCGLDGNKINFRHFNEGTGTRFNYCLFSARVSLGLFLKRFYFRLLFFFFFSFYWNCLTVNNTTVNSMSDQCVGSTMLDCVVSDEIKRPKNTKVVLTLQCFNSFFWHLSIARWEKWWKIYANYLSLFTSKIIC